jgi:hypothetical protein
LKISFGGSEGDPPLRRKARQFLRNDGDTARLSKTITAYIQNQRTVERPDPPKLT